MKKGGKEEIEERNKEKRLKKEREKKTKQSQKPNTAYILVNPCQQRIGVQKKYL